VNPPRNRSLAIACVLAVVVVWMYGGILSSLARQWESDDNYSHGFFIVPLAFFFAWERRAALANAPNRPSVAGLFVILGSLLLLLTGRWGAELFLTRISLVGVLAGITLFVWGRDQLRILVFPIAFLLLMIPLPAIIFNQIAFPLQLLASRAGEATLGVVGIPVLREGNLLQLPSQTLEIAEACSGIRSLVSLITLAVVLGYFTERRTARRVLIALAAIPIAIVANAARVVGTGLMSELISPAAADGFFHLFSGWIIFVVAFGGLLAVQRAIAGRGPKPALPVPLPGRPAEA